MRRTSGGPYCEPHFPAFAKHEYIIITAADRFAFLEAKAGEESCQSLRRQIGWLRVKDGLATFIVRIVNHSEVMFRLLSIRTIVMPVVPDRKQNFIGSISQPLARKQLA